MTRALLVYHRPSLGRLIGDAANVSENIAAFGRHSKFQVSEVNAALGFPPGLPGTGFDAVILHYSLFAYGPKGYLLGEEFLDWLSRFRGYKVAFFQDEYHFCKKRFAFIDEFGIDCVYTMLEPPHAEQVYGAKTKASKIVSHLPGYVGTELVEAADRLRKSDAERGIDVGYRGRPSPPYWGRGGQEKWEIGVRFAELAADRDLVLDIGTGEEERIYGEDWHRFLVDSRATLGAESGVSCFDLEDEVLEEYQRLSADGSEPTIEELEKGALGRWDGKIPYRTIGPRNFEAAAFGVTQILFEGGYSGRMEPMRHYIPLAKDFSNLDEVLERFGDPALRGELAANARRDLIDSGENSYERFIEGFDRTLAEAGLRPEGAVAGTDIERALRVPARRRAARRASEAWEWLAWRRPRTWRVLNALSRPIVVPLRKVTNRNR